MEEVPSVTARPSEAKAAEGFRGWPPRVGRAEDESIRIKEVGSVGVVCLEV